MSSVEKDTFVPTELTAQASAKLEEEVRNDLAIPDPKEDHARGSFRKTLKDSDKDKQKG